MNVLIVDDEQLIRDGIRCMLQSRDAEPADIFEACNGAEALEIISERDVDIVVTDIKMHDMDGIALLREASRLKDRPEFIILSGYDDFQYAKESIKYGAKAYLLKPVKKKELFETLRTVEEEILLERNRERKLESMRSVIGSVREHELNYLIMSESLSENDMKKISDALDIGILHGDYFVGILEKKNKRHESGPLDYHQAVKKQISEFVQSADSVSVVFNGINGNIVLISESEGMYRELAKRLQDATSGDFVIGTSRRASGARSLRNAYLEAEESLKYKVLRSTESLIRFDAADRLEKNFTMPMALLERIVQLIGTKRGGELNEWMGRLFDNRQILSHNILYAERLAEEAYKLVIEPFIESSVGDQCRAPGTRTESLRSIHNFDSINDYIYAFKKFVFDVNACMLVLAEEYKGMSEIDEAVAYIKGNYRKELNLTIVANHVSLNYSYFSNLFSEKMGVNFHDYLKAIRIDKSKELLADTGYRINEIALMIGYKNAKHFATHFRSLTGISPLEYRNKIAVHKLQQS
jgi:two-component system response regulator YesN